MLDVPADFRVKGKESEKYQDLARDLRKIVERDCHNFAVTVR